MSVIASFTVPAEEFTLDATIGGHSEVTVRLDRVIPTGDTFIPYFWAANDSVEAIEARLREDGDVESFTIVDSKNGEALVRVEWAQQLDGVLEAMAATGATILEGVGAEDTWRLQLRFDDHDDLTRFFERCAERSITLELETVHNPGFHSSLRLQSKLTDAQRETLAAALSEGYFDVPRRTNLIELADRLDISDSAVSQRLRRAVATVLDELALELETPGRREP